MAIPDHLPVDENVHVPESVRRAAELANATHAAAYTPPGEPQPEPQPAPQPEPPQLQVHGQEPQPEPQPEPHPAPTPAEQNVGAEEWRHRFLSMQGRFNAAQRQIGSMEQQMQELGQELVRTQNLLASFHQQPAPQAMISETHGNLITQEDREGYGDELIDLARRAAREALTPELEQLRRENAQLTARVQNTGKRELFATLDGAVPNWRQVNKMPAFLHWLRLPNVYTGQVRQQMLKAAVDGADAPKAIALFRDFIAEATATGAMPQAQQDEPAAPSEQPPRTPAVHLEQLAAPGRPRPAAGDTQVPSEKPIYSRAQIAKFYDDKRRGLYAGREAEANQIEADLIAAQSQGRIR